MAVKKGVAPFIGTYIVTSIQSASRTVQGVTRAHNGIDLVGSDDITVYSTVNGIVEYIGWQDSNDQGAGYGYYMRIRQINTKRTFYFGHMKVNSSKLKSGDTVSIGDVIGVMGSTGRSTGPHLHYEIRKGSKILNCSNISGIPNKQGTYESRLKKSNNNNSSNIIDIAKKELGNGGNKYQTWYGLHDQWCHMFVSWCAYKAGIPQSDFPKTASTDVGMAWFKKEKKFELKGQYTPQSGDVVYFKTGRSHVGLVDKVAGKTLYTVEGNSSNLVKARTYSLSDATITGYGTPDYVSNAVITGTINSTTFNRENALLREVAYVNSKGEPFINVRDIELSVINYTDAISSMLSNTSASPNVNVNTDKLPGVQKAIAEYFLNKGLNRAATAGILVNLEQESGFRIDAMEMNQDPAFRGWGLVQWSNWPRASYIPGQGRRDRFEKAVPDWKHNLTGQLDYIWKEISAATGYLNSTLKPMRNVANTLVGAKEATRLWQWYYEGLQNSSELAERQNRVEYYFKKLIPQLTKGGVT